MIKDDDGTVCMTGHPVFERLWLQCTDNRPERTLIEAERRVANMPPILSKALLYGPQLSVSRLPIILHRTKASTINAVTRMWVLDELRWLAQRDADDAPRTLLDTMLSRLNHGDMLVVVHLSDLIHLIKAVTPSGLPLLTGAEVSRLLAEGLDDV